MSLVAVIPSRYASSRFLGKAVAPVAGVPLVTRVASAVVSSGVADEVIVATDDDRIAAAVAHTGAEVSLTAAAYRSGGDRVAATVAGRVGDADVVLDVQGDEALVDGQVLRAAHGALIDGGWDIGTVAVPIDGGLNDPDVVKVVIGADGRALRFARQLQDPEQRRCCWAHVGIYAFSGRALRRFTELPTSDGERAERLEQLRAMEAGMSIGVATMRRAMPSINRPADVRRVEACIEALVKARRGQNQERM